MTGATEMQLPSSSEVGNWLAVAGVAVTAALVAWLKQSKTKLEVRQNDSQGGWITKLEEKVAKAEKGEQEALLRERETWKLHNRDLEENSSLRLRVSMQTEKIDRLEKKIALIQRLLIRERPDLEPILSSSFSEFDDAPAHRDSD